MTHRTLGALAIATLMLLAATALGPMAGLAATGDAEPAAPLAQLAAMPPESKVEAALWEAARNEPKREVYAVVQSADPVDLGPLGRVVHRWTWPAGEDLALVEVQAGAVPAIAAIEGVYAVSAGDVDMMPEPPPEPYREEGPTRLDPAEIGRRARLAPPWSPGVPATGREAVTGAERADDDGRIDGWYDVRRGHAAEEAWQLGYRGEGVKVGVLDYAVDFAHPDLQETWAVLPEGHPYAGWPQVFDPIAGYYALQDKDRDLEDRRSRTGGNGMIELYQTSPVSETVVEGSTVVTACFQPLVIVGTPQQPQTTLGELDCSYVVPPASVGGTVRFGHHPDGVLRDAGAKPDLGILGEYAGVLIVDEAEADVYDTVYVDVDGDRDFTDEKPVTQSDPVSWRDISGDGIADVSGGLLYWISDGEKPFPSSWVWGLEEDIPPAGEVIGILYVVGDHGTLCASSVVSQGVLGVPPDRRIPFRDLPGDQQPPSLSLGLAPDAKLVSIGDVYRGSGNVVFAASWRYAVFGHEIDRNDDDLQVTSNSYGFSGTDNDGWDGDSRLVDYYVRTFGPNMSFLFSTGNGGPGYGTFAPPSPSVAMGVAASTQQGSTSGESITETTQITFGDITPFSNRGPGADGRIGVSVAANGNSGTGAEPINFMSDGAHALAVWGGTSRSSPVAAGAMALVYEAFQAENGRWPTWLEAQSILMSGARYAAYDPFTMGAGVVDAADSVRIAAGQHGVFAVPPEWTAGDFRGEVFPAFAKLVQPGETATTSFTLHNPTDGEVEVGLSAKTPRRIGSYDAELTTDLLAQSPPSPVADYLVPIDRERIPEGTELMIARGRFPMSEFDVDGDYTADNRFDFGVLQHTDINGDGVLWDDADGNGVVNSRQMLDSYVAVTWSSGSREIESLAGSITPPLPEDGLHGQMAWYGRGCNDDDRFQEVADKIALIERGVCTFTEKILNAQNDGAIGVVVFTDARAKTSMGGDGTGVAIPGVMIDRQPGLRLVELLDAGEVLETSVFARDYVGVGLSGAGPIVYEDTELQQWEFMRVSYDNDARNHWGVPVHHPLERWADGLYLALWHGGRTDAVTNTHITMRLDFYAYEDWEALTLDQSTVTIPAGGEVTVEAMLTIPEDAPVGALQGAIFADYARMEGDEADLAPAGYELPHLRTVIPVNANVAAEYDWQGAVTLGGASGADPDALYDNGAMWGTFKWDWRPESGDWRFYFVDAAEPEDNTFWLFRTMWSDEDAGHSDIDTRVYGPANDRFSDPDHPDNADEDMSDPAWYGPYTLDRLTRSPYLVRSGSVWPFDTTSGWNEDWLAAQAGEGLHAIMLHNILFSGSQTSMPFSTTVSSVHVAQTSVSLRGDVCSTVRMTPETDIEGFTVEGFGMAVPEVFEDQPAVQDDPDDVATASFQHEIGIETQAGRFDVTLEGAEGDDLDLFLLYDADGDGLFAHPDEVIAQSTTPTADERISLAGFAPAGDYQVWVHGYAVEGEDSTFDLTLDVVSGRSLLVQDVPDTLPAGETSEFVVCADLTALEGEDGPASGVLVAGPSGAPTLFQMPVRWYRDLLDIFLPTTVRGFGFDR